MPRRSSYDPEETAPSLAPAEAIEVLRRQKEKGKEILKGQPIPEAKYDAWCRTTSEFIKKAFGSNSDNFSAFHAPASFTVYSSDMDEAYFAQRRVESLSSQLEVLGSLVEQLEMELEVRQVGLTKVAPRRNVGPACVFIGHGRSKLWARLKIFLEDDLHVRTTFYETESRVGESIVPVLEKMLDEASFAVLVLTAEDETQAGTLRARQNVVHEAGLFQGRLGFRRAVLLVQRGIEEFSNAAGLQHIPFSEDHVEEAFYELQRVLKREGQVQ